MGLCVSDIPVGMRLTLRFPGGLVTEGEVLHNYGAGLVIRREGAGVAGEVIQLDAQSAQSIEPMDKASEDLWLANIAKKQAEFDAMIASIKGTKEAAQCTP